MSRNNPGWENLGWWFCSLVLSFLGVGAVAFLGLLIGEPAYRGPLVHGDYLMLAAVLTAAAFGNYFFEATKRARRDRQGRLTAGTDLVALLAGLLIGGAAALAYAVVVLSDFGGPKLAEPLEPWLSTTAVILACLYSLRCERLRHARYTRDFKGRWPVRPLLDAIQKSALFDYGLDVTARLEQARGRHDPLAALYEAKYLVQLFRYDEAKAVLEHVPDSKEKRAISFNIKLNLAEDDEAATVARGVFEEVASGAGTEQDFLILRNSVHLFRPDEARALVTAALHGFELLDNRFGIATARNNLGIVELAFGSIGDARESFETARDLLTELGSTEVYQPLVNLSALSLLEDDVTRARQLLLDARDAAPGSLLQDAAMFDLNLVTLRMCDGGYSLAEAASRMRAVVVAAEKTWDLRFRDVARWFADSLAELLSGGAKPLAESARTIEAIRSSERVPLEVFVRRDIGGVELELPYVLSPHWRY